MSPKRKVLFIPIIIISKNFNKLLIFKVTVFLFFYGLLEWMPTVSIWKVGDFEARNFRLNTKFDTSQKPWIYYYFAYFSYTLLAIVLIIYCLMKWTCKLIPPKLHLQLEQPKTTIIVPLHLHLQKLRLLYFLLGLQMY